MISVNMLKSITGFPYWNVKYSSDTDIIVTNANMLPSISVLLMCVLHVARITNMVASSDVNERINWNWLLHTVITMAIAIIVTKFMLHDKVPLSNHILAELANKP